MDKLEKPYKIYLRDTLSGKTGVYLDEYFQSDEGELGSWVYSWGEGNYSCDCNRSLFLGMDDELACNEGDNRVVVDKIEDPNGNLFYDGDPVWFYER